MRERSREGPSDDLLLHREVRNRLRTLPVPFSTVPCSEPGRNCVCWMQQSSWIRTAMGLPPACPAGRKWSPRAEYHHHPWAASPLPPPFDWNVCMDCAGAPESFQCWLRSLLSEYTDAVSLWHDVAAATTLRRISFPFYTSHWDLFWGCTFHLKLEQSKVKAHTCCLRAVFLLRCLAGSGPQCGQDQ